MVKLYDGCYGVKRDGDIVGPFREYAGEFYKVEGRLGVFAYDGFHWIPFSEAVSLGVFVQTFDRVTRVFPDHASALAWANRKPWWKRWPLWKVWTFLLLTFCAGCLLASCTTPTAPEPYVCKVQDGNGTWYYCGTQDTVKS